MTLSSVADLQSHIHAMLSVPSVDLSSVSAARVRKHLADSCDIDIDLIEENEAAIDVLIADVIQAISALRPERKFTPNAGSPADRSFGLNPDVLCSIFSLVAEECPPRSPLVSVRGDLGWIGLTHVCRFWREVGIGHSILWGRVLCTFPSAFSTILSRISIDSPLVVTFDQGNPLSSDRAQSRLIDRLLHRLEALRLCANADFLCALSGKDYPQLQSLSLKQRYSYTRPSFFYDRPPIVANALTTLSFDGYLVPFVAPALRSVSVTGHADGGWAISIVLALDILECCPMLEELVLSDIFHGHRELPSESQACGNREIPLEHLRNASITTNDLAFATLWRHLSTPAISNLIITSFDSASNGRPSHPSVIFSAIRPLLARMDGVQSRPYSGTTFSGGITLTSTQPTLSCSIVFCAPAIFYVRYLYVFSSALAGFLLSDQILSVSPGAELRLSHPFLLFVSRSVTSLTVAIHFFETISRGSEFDFPRLRTLTVEIFYPHFYTSKDSSDEFEEAWDFLISTLRTRAQAGRTLNTLRLVRQGSRDIAPATLRKLRSHEAAGIRKVRKYVIQIIFERIEEP